MFIKQPYVSTLRNAKYITRVAEQMGSEWILGRLAEGLQNGYSWLRIGAGGGLL
jgi:hypothetical protein